MKDISRIISINIVLLLTIPMVFSNCKKSIEVDKGKEVDPPRQSPVSLKDGLVGYWAFEEGEGGDVADSSSSQANGTMHNSVSWTEGYLGRGKGVQFDLASDGFVDVGRKLYPHLNGAKQITLSSWIKSSSAPIKRYDIFNTFNEKAVGFSVYIAPKGEIRVAGRSNASETFRSNGFRFTHINVWAHIVATIDYENNEFLLYVNGEKVPVNTGNPPRFANDSYTINDQGINDYIGGYKGRDHAFDGSIDEVRIYNRKLNEAEIHSLAERDANPDLVSPQDAEREKIARIRVLMQSKVALHIGENHAIAGDKRYFINGEHPLVMPFLEQNRLYVPVSFVAKKFNATVNGNESTGTISILHGTRSVELKDGDSFLRINGQSTPIDGAILLRDAALYVPADAVAMILDKSIYKSPSGEIVIYGDNADVFAQESFQDLVALMPAYFLPKRFTAPRRDVRPTRQELLFLDPSERKYVGSPSLEKLPDGTLIASGTSSGEGIPVQTLIYRSLDNGMSWTFVTSLSNIMWANLFHHNDALYLMGTNGSVAINDIVIRRSQDGGATWTNAVDAQSGVIFKGGAGSTPPNYHGAPTPVAKANGRIYRAFGDFYAREFPKIPTFLISAPENSDLLKADSWTSTEKLEYNYQNWTAPYNFSLPGWLEGNAVVAPDGKVWNFNRFNSAPHHDKAAIMRLSEDGSKLLFDYPQDIIDFPGGNTKFSIKYDERTQKYYSLVNNSVDATSSDHRCVLSLVVSDDLINWTIVETVLYDDNLHIWEDALLLVGYQYVDFVFNGNDIVFVVRESWGGAPNYHDANRFTSYVLKDYAKFVN